MNNKPPIDRKHVFEGEIQGKKNRASGYHHVNRFHPYARTTGNVVREDPSSHVFEQAVEVQKPSTGRWHAKRQNSTFFPSDFSQDKVERTLRRAYTISGTNAPNTVQVPWRRFADTQQESGGTMNVRVEYGPNGIRGFPVL